MDFSSFFSIIQTLFVLIIVIILANISLKLLNKNMNKNSRIIKVVERTSVSTNSSLGVVDVCGTYYLMSFTDKDNKILKELNSEDVDQVLNEKEGMRKKS